MIFKRSQAAFWDAGMPVSHLLNVGSRGLDISGMEKYAAADDFKTSVKPEKGFTFVHVITNGALERYGSNGNSDGFNEAACQWTFPEAPKGREKTAELKGGLKKYHSTYMQFGGVYRKHQNSRKKDPKTGKPYEKEGSIAAETYNDNMHRGELILKLADDKWASALQKIASGQPVWWSMGTAVPFDTCSMCGNQAKKRADYCDHLKFMKNKIASSGHQAFAINDETWYHDISEVDVPAFRIAGTLEKVAAGDLIVRPESEAPGLWIPAELANMMMGVRERSRWQLMQKMARMEKEVTGTSLSAEQEKLSKAMKLSEEDEKSAASKLKDLPSDDMLSALKKNNMLLTPRTFALIVHNRSGKTDDSASSSEVSEPEWLDTFLDRIRSLYSDALDDGSDDALSDGKYCPMCSSCSRKADLTASGLKEKFSLDPEPVRRRIIITVIRGGTPESTRMEKKAVSEASEKTADLVAREYLKYQLSWLAGSSQDYTTEAALLNAQA